MFDEELLDLARNVLTRARERNIHLATAESCTGGLVMGCLTEIAGSSDVVDRGFITYTNRAKAEILGVSIDTLSRYGAVSEVCAREMAEGAVRKSASTIAVAVTGIAGPGGGTTDKPVGLVHMAAHRRGGITRHEERRFGDIGREKVRRETTAAALKLVLNMMT